MGEPCPRQARRNLEHNFPMEKMYERVVRFYGLIGSG